MPRLPRVTADEMIRLLRRHGFESVRQSGSHVIMKNADGRRVTIPSHAGRILHPKIVKSILTDAGWTDEQLIAWLAE